MEQNRSKNSRKRLNSLILLVAFTAVMLIVSTYAWFSAQKNVTISGLDGKVNVAEGLMVSLDAKNWTQSVSLKDTEVTNFLDAGYTLATPYQGGSNLKSSELVPVSTTGTEDIYDDTDGDGTIEEGEQAGNSELSFYRGININAKELYSIQKTDKDIADPTNNQFPGYHAIDIFLQNSSKINPGDDGQPNTNDANEEKQGEAEETLQLNTNSLLKLVTGGSELTGLQNTTRVALGLYNYKEGLTIDGSTDTSSVAVTANQAQILKAYDGAVFTDVAIWEPNAGNHTDFVTTNNNNITWNATVKGLYLTNDVTKVVNGNNVTTAAADRDNKFLATEKLPTYALISAATTVNETLASESVDKVTRATGKIADIYNWNDAASDPTVSAGLKRQIALQTEKSESDYTTIDGGVRNLVSITSPGAKVYEYGNESDVVKFDIKKNQVAKVRLYIWLEGQDVDTINQASHGGGVYLDLGLVKGQEVGPQGS